MPLSNWLGFSFPHKMQGISDPNNSNPIDKQKPTKKDILNLLKTRPDLLQIDLEPLQIVSTEQAKKDFRREKVLFNGIPFVPNGNDSYRNDLFATALEHYTQRIIKIHPFSYNNTLFHSLNSQLISDIILQSSCRTSAGADSYFLLYSMFCNDSLFLTQHTNYHNNDDLPISVNLFVDVNAVSGSEALISRIQVWNAFTVYENNDNNDNNNNSNNRSTSTSVTDDPPAWLEIQSQVSFLLFSELIIHLLFVSYIYYSFITII